MLDGEPRRRGFMFWSVEVSASSFSHSLCAEVVEQHKKVTIAFTRGNIK